MSTETSRSVPELLSEIVGQLSTLFRKEMQLARAEMGEKASEMSGAAPALGAGAALLLGALILSLLAAAALVSRLLGLPAGWGLLIVGVLAGLGGWLLIRGALSKLRATSLVPQRTAGQLSRDVQVAKEQVR